MQTGRNTLVHRINSWFALQAVYMPVVATLRKPADTSVAADELQKPEEEKLWMPSEVPKELWAGLGYRLVEKETSLREAEADDALHQVRLLIIFVSSHLFDYSDIDLDTTPYPNQDEPCELQGRSRFRTVQQTKYSSSNSYHFNLRQAQSLVSSIQCGIQFTSCPRRSSRCLDPSTQAARPR